MNKITTFVKSVGQKVNDFVHNETVQEAAKMAVIGAAMGAAQMAAMYAVSYGVQYVDAKLHPTPALPEGESAIIDAIEETPVVEVITEAVV